MGQTASKSETLNLTKITKALTNEFTSACEQSAAANVEFVVRDLVAEGDISISGNKISQDVSIDAKCVNDSINESDVNNIVKEDIKKQLQQTIEGAPSGSSFQSDLNTSITDLSTTISNKFVKQCAQAFQADLTVTIENNKSKGNIFIDGNQISQVFNIVADCINSDENINIQVDEINKSVKTQIKSKHIGVFTPMNMASSGGSSLICCIMLIVVLLLFIK